MGGVISFVERVYSYIDIGASRRGQHYACTRASEPRADFDKWRVLSANLPFSLIAQPPPPLSLPKNDCWNVREI